MKRKLILLLAVTLLLIMVAAAPALAEDKVSLVVNGDPVKLPDVMMQDGNTMVAVDAWARLVGADVAQDVDGSLRVIENDIILTMTPGEQNAFYDGEPVTMPAPQKVAAGKVYVPLRFVSEAFGFEVGWDAAQRLVTLDRNETRDGLTASELLVKANQAVMDVNTYTMDGKMQMAFNMLVDGEKIEEMPGSMNIEMTGQLQNKPMQAYIKQKITPEVETEVPGLDMAMEMYMTEQNMYVKTPNLDWVVQEMPFGPEFWQEQQNIQSDPLKALDQMKEWGMLLNFGNDVTLDDQDYYVVNTTMDMDKFMGAMQDMMQQIMPNMSVDITPGEMEQMQQIMQTLLDKSKIDFFYTAYVNKDTMITDVLKMDLQLDMTMNPADFGAPEDLESDADTPEEIRMLIDMKGDFKISDLDSPFVAPDVSNAKPMSEIMNEAFEVTPQP